MLENIHQHILNELHQSARTDTICIVTAVVFNLVILGISWSTAVEGRKKKKGAHDLVLTVFIALTLLVNSLAVAALYTGKSTRGKLLDGLLAMYEDNGVSQYFDSSLLTHYDTRYLLFTGVILALAATAIVVPLLVRIFQKEEPKEEQETEAPPAETSA